MPPTMTITKNPSDAPISTNLSQAKKKQKVGESSFSNQIFRNPLHKKRYEIVHHCRAICGRTIDWSAFNETDFGTKIKGYLKAVGWLGLANVKESKYNLELVHEFYSGIVLKRTELDIGIDEWDSEYLFTMIDGQKQCITPLLIGKIIGCSSTTGQTSIPKNFSASDAWKHYSNVKGVYDKYAKASSLGNFEFRFLHHFIATTIHCRSGSYAFVTREDLWLLHCVASRESINLPFYILDRMKYTLKAIIHRSEKRPPTLQQTPLPYANLVTMIAKAVGRLSSKYSLIPLAVKYNMTSIGKMGYKVVNGKLVKKRMKVEEQVEQEEIGDDVDEGETPMEEDVGPHTSVSNNKLVTMMNKMNLRFNEFGARIGNLEHRFDSFESLMMARFDHIDASLAQLLNKEETSTTQHMHTYSTPDAYVYAPVPHKPQSVFAQLSSAHTSDNAQP